LNENGSKIILDLCGGTGAWSRPYAEAGYDVRNITLPEYDVRTFKPPENVYGILAAPPCTMFSIARTTAKKPRDLKGGMEIVVACLNIIWNCRYKNRLKFWALENPMGILRQFLGVPRFTFDPYEYGNPFTKKTDIWEYFNIPKKKPLNPYQYDIISAGLKGRKYKTRLFAIPCWGEDITTGNQKIKRAITPSGFAQAFFRANQ